LGEVEVKNIVIKIGEKEILLNLEEAKELKKVLDDLLGVKLIEYYIPYFRYYQNWNITPYIGPQWSSGTICCSNKNNGNRIG
jgi:hypothetical protein